MSRLTQVAPLGALFTLALGPTGYDEEFGHGRINAYRAVTGQSPAIALEVSTRSTVNLRSQGNMQVTLLGREAVTFGLDMIQLATVRLGSTPVANRGNGTPFATWSDVDGDSPTDLVLHFSVPALRSNGDLVSSTSQSTLTGSLSDGRSIRGTVPVVVVNPRP